MSPSRWANGKDISARLHPHHVLDLRLRYAMEALHGPPLHLAEKERHAAVNHFEGLCVLPQPCRARACVQGACLVEVSTLSARQNLDAVGRLHQDASSPKRSWLVNGVLECEAICRTPQLDGDS